MKSLFFKLLLGTSFLLSLSTAKAQSSGATDNAVVKYLGTQDDMLVFDVAYANPTGGKFQITIKEQGGAELYQNVFNEKPFYKRFRLPMSESDRVVFVIRDFHDSDIVKSFDINVNSHIVREIAVRKIN